MIIDIICSIVSIASIMAAYYNGELDSRTRMLGFSIWNVTNPVFAVLFFGVFAGWWVVDIGLLPTVGMYCVFTFTSARGYWIHREEVMRGGV